METIDFHFRFEDLSITVEDMKSISPEESQGIDDFLDVFEEVLAEGPTLIDAKGGFTVHDDFECLSDALRIDSTVLNTGKIIAKAFRKAEKVVVFACTAGPGVKAAYDRYMEQGEPLKAYFADTLGTVAVEKATDRIHDHIRHAFLGQGLHGTNRYSPGYCGWHVGEQQRLWSFLPPSYCGITLTPSSLMLPVKSVSGLVGLGPHARKNPYACAVCEMQHCIYRRHKK